MLKDSRKDQSAGKVHRTKAEGEDRNSPMILTWKLREETKKRGQGSKENRPSGESVREVTDCSADSGAVAKDKSLTDATKHEGCCSGRYGGSKRTGCERRKKRRC